MKIYNTLTRAKEEFVPLTPGEIAMYSCGVTVYDLSHVGHARMMIVFDMISRYLRFAGYRVTFVRNFTDIEDKIIRRANQEGVPAGVVSERYVAAFREDIRVRTEGLEHANRTGYQVDAREIRPGLIYSDSNVRVTAFLVEHGSWEEAFGFRFDTADRSIVISGDTRATEAVVTACSGCDVLVHEVYSRVGWEGRPPQWQRYHASFHTSAPDLGRLAARARPGLLVLYHQLLWGGTEQDVVSDIRRGFRGRVVFGNDLDVY